MSPKAAARSDPRTLLEPTEFFQVGKEDTGMRIYLRYDLFRALDDHAVRDTSREQAGLLVGQVQEGGEPFIVVEDAIEIGVGDESTGRFSARSWQHARRVARSRYQDKVILGWFHTHPGTGLELSQEEREVHTNFFPERWQVVYMVDPVSRDRNFYLPTAQGKLESARGFRIYGKEAPNSASSSPERSAPPARPGDDQLRERYLERSLEKIQRLVRRPAVRPIDYLVLVLLCANLAWMTLRPAPTARLDSHEVTQGQQKLSEQVTALSNRIEKLEQHLAAMQVLDEQLSLKPETPSAPSALPESPGALETGLSPLPSPLRGETPAGVGSLSAALTPAPQATTTPAAPQTPEAVATAPPTGRMVHLHKVKGGDTMSTLCEHYYGTSSLKTIKALAHFNRLRSFDIFPGETLKIPSKESLRI